MKTLISLICDSQFFFVSECTIIFHLIIQEIDNKIGTYCILTHDKPIPGDCYFFMQDPNQLIRGSALRVLSSIRVPVIAPIMMLAIKEVCSALF